MPAETEGSALSSILGWLCSKGGEGIIPSAPLNVAPDDSPSRTPHEVHEMIMRDVLQVRTANKYICTFEPTWKHFNGYWYLTSPVVGRCSLPKLEGSGI